MKHCGKCGLDKPEEAFALRRKDGRVGRQAWCRDCVAERYRATREHHGSLVKARKAAVRADYRQRIRSYLEAHPCVDCREPDPIILEFDHVRGTKVENVTTMAAQLRPWPLIEEEIAKCEVRCCSCHRRATVARLAGVR